MRLVFHLQPTPMMTNVNVNYFTIPRFCWQHQAMNVAFSNVDSNLK
ncbi:hypothetical protein THIX_90569 [Thiomonas sp. X19]|nr:hypothetical protein THIX_90569 [Thiomonas sp. X19]